MIDARARARTYYCYMDDGLVATTDERYSWATREIPIEAMPLSEKLALAE